MRLGRIVLMVSIGYLTAYIMNFAFGNVTDVIYVAGKRIIDMLMGVR